MSKKIISILREHLHFFVVSAVLIVVMTFPTIVYVFDTETFWLPTGNHPDTWGKFWDAWYGRRILSGQADFYFTDLLFYPHGSSLVYHNFSIPHMLALSGLQTIMPDSNAFSLTFLLIVASVTGASYLYMLYLFRDRWIALLGAVIVGLSPHVVGYPEHPELRFITTVPLSLYLFHRGFAERRYKLVFWSALIAGVTVYISMHVAVCLGFALVAYAVYFVAFRWRDTAFWRASVIFALIAIAVSAPRVVPMLASSDALEQSIAVREGAEVGNDLLEFLVNARNPIFRYLFQDQSFSWGFNRFESRYSSYIGYSVIFLILVGLAARRSRRKMIPWIALAAPFFLLRLGSVLTVAGIRYEHIVLPKHLLDELLPGVTEGFTMTSNFHMGALVPLAALACIGASTLLSEVKTKRRPIIIVLMVGLVCFEYYQPVRQGFVTDEELAFLEWLESESGEVRIINLPFGNWSERLYSFHQARSGFPHSTGIIARRPSNAFDYVKSNYLLDSWHRRQAVKCTWKTQERILPALKQLKSDGFSHVVFHQIASDADPYNESFVGIDASYVDDYVSIFRLADLLEPCAKDFIADFIAKSPNADIYLMPSAIHERYGTVVSFDPSLQVHEDFLPYFTHVVFDRKPAVHISYDREDELVIQSSNDLFADLNNLADFNDGIWLILRRNAHDVTQMPVYRNWFTPTYRFCARFLDHDDGTIDLYLKHAIPCDAVRDQSTYKVLYDNGIRLHNWVYDVDSTQITFHLQWSTRLDRTYSLSLQLFDHQDNKAQQFDAVIEQEPVSTYSLDISGLPEGAYVAKLILYDFETGLSEGGIMEDSNRRFERELEITSFEIG